MVTQIILISANREMMLTIMVLPTQTHCTLTLAHNFQSLEPPKPRTFQWWQRHFRMFLTVPLTSSERVAGKLHFALPRAKREPFLRPSECTLAYGEKGSRKIGPVWVVGMWMKREAGNCVANCCSLPLGGIIWRSSEQLQHFMQPRYASIAWRLSEEARKKIETHAEHRCEENPHTKSEIRWR